MATAQDDVSLTFVMMFSGNCEDEIGRKKMINETWQNGTKLDDGWIYLSCIILVWFCKIHISHVSFIFFLSTWCYPENIITEGKMQNNIICKLFLLSQSTWGEQPVEDIPNFTCIYVFIYVFVSRLHGQMKNDTDLKFGTHTPIDLV